MMRVSLSPEQFRELLLSHHPDCPDFENDVVTISGRRLCAGCLFGYPAALLTLLMFSPAGTTSILISLLLAVLSQFRRITKNRNIQNFFRITAGIALGFGLGGAYWAIMTANWLLVFLLIFGAVIYAVLKAWSMKRKIVKWCGC